MKEKLRKITFSLAYYYFEPDLTDEQQKEQEEETRQRNGYFHKWVEKSDISPQLKNHTLRRSLWLKTLKPAKCIRWNQT